MVKAANSALWSLMNSEVLVRACGLGSRMCTVYPPATKTVAMRRPKTPAPRRTMGRLVWFCIIILENWISGKDGCESSLKS